MHRLICRLQTLVFGDAHQHSAGSGSSLDGQVIDYLLLHIHLPCHLFLLFGSTTDVVYFGLETNLNGLETNLNNSIFNGVWILDQGSTI